LIWSNSTTGSRWAIFTTKNSLLRGGWEKRKSMNGKHKSEKKKANKQREKVQSVSS
jgi:hypothetical protein